MYVCMYVCTYVRMYVCAYVRMYVCMQSIVIYIGSLISSVHELSMTLFQTKSARGEDMELGFIDVHHHQRRKTTVQVLTHNHIDFTLEKNFGEIQNLHAKISTKQLSPTTMRKKLRMCIDPMEIQNLNDM